MRIRGASEVRLATSRTETARIPLPRPTPLNVFLNPVSTIVDAYVGEPSRPPQNPAFPGFSMDLPFRDVAIQFQLYLSQPDATAFLTLDLGGDRDLARIELYGNPLLPPQSQSEKPICNFGLPSVIRVLMSEEASTQNDLHRLSQRGVFYSNPLVDWREVWSSLDYRALWGWNTIHLNSAFGRYVTFVFSGLPRLPLPRRPSIWGLDLQRIVLYPYLEDADHHPHVEHSIVSARVGRYSIASDYWDLEGEPAPQPDTHQGVFFDQSADQLPLPCALNGLLPISPANAAADVFVSHPVPQDPAEDNRVFLITEATSDHEPLLEGVHLVFRSDPGKGIYQGPKLPYLPHYLIRVHVTSDREAAHSSDPSHPAWRLVVAEQTVEPENLNEAWLFFAEPVVARWVRLTVRPVAPEGGDPSQATVFQLHRLDLMRCQSWEIAPLPEEDIDVDNVFIRLRGPRILDDYAYIEGQHGFGITVEIRNENGVYEKLRAFRNLVEVIEETYNRIFSNHRGADKPVQRYREVSDSASSSHGHLRQRTSGIQSATVLPKYKNRQVVKTGSLSNYVKNLQDGFESDPFTGLPAADTDGVVTTRTYEGNVQSAGLPSLDLTQANITTLFNDIVAWGQGLAQQGFPFSVGVGGNFGFSGGLAAGVQGSANAGVSLNAGTQLGGGVTKSETVGDQASAVLSESHTLESRQKQKIVASNQIHTRQATTSHDDRTVVREDHSPEVRKTGLEVRYGGHYEDLLLITIPVGRKLKGGYAAHPYAPASPPVSREALRVRVDYLPRGVRMDVEFRGKATPHPEDR